MTIRCPQCNTRNPVTNQFCGKCGTRLSVPTMPAVADSEAAPGAEPPLVPSHRSNVVAIGATFVVLGVFGFCMIASILGAFRTNPTATAPGVVSAQTTLPLIVQTPNPAFATAAVAQATIYAINKNPAFGPADNSMKHSLQTDSALYPTNLNVADFVAEARFTNIYPADSAWSYGFQFRSGNGAEYAMDVTADARWTLHYVEDVKGSVRLTTLGTGTIPGYNSVEGGTNLVRLVAKGDRLLFFVNDAYVTTALTPRKTDAGDVRIFIKYAGLPAKSETMRRFDGFSVWSLPS